MKKQIKTLFFIYLPLLLLSFSLGAQDKPSIKLLEKLPKKIEEKIESIEIKEASIELPKEQAEENLILERSTHLKVISKPIENPQTETPDGFIFEIIP